MTDRFKTYDRALDYLFKFTNYENVVNFPYDAAKLNLVRMRGLLEFLGNPHLAPLSAHIAGTKGKGSTTMMLGAIARASGRNVGLYTSPHLVRLEERIVVNGRMIPRGDFLKEMNALLPYLEEQKKNPGPYAAPTFFEIMTAMAWDFFRRKKVDFAVMEVGLGGRLDSTNVIAPAVCVITSISMDHMRQLGNTIALIAREKAGIVKPGVPVVTGCRDAEALSVIEQACREKSSALYRVDKEFRFEDAEGGRFFVEFGATRFGPLALKVPGAHQRLNAACAVVAAEILRRAGKLDFADDIPARALASLAIPGRVEVVRRRPLILNDGAHNAASVRCTLETIRDEFAPRSLSIVFAAGADKDIAGMVGVIREMARDVRLKRLVLTTTGGARSSPPASLREAFGSVGFAVETVENVEMAWNAASRGELGPAVCFTGSMYLAGKVAELRARKK